MNILISPSYLFLYIFSFSRTIEEKSAEISNDFSHTDSLKDNCRSVLPVFAKKIKGKKTEVVKYGSQK